MFITNPVKNHYGNNSVLMTDHLPVWFCNGNFACMIHTCSGFQDKTKNSSADCLNLTWFYWLTFSFKSFENDNAYATITFETTDYSEFCDKYDHIISVLLNCDKHYEIVKDFSECLTMFFDNHKD